MLKNDQIIDWYTVCNVFHPDIYEIMKTFLADKVFTDK